MKEDTHKKAMAELNSKTDISEVEASYAAIKNRRNFREVDTCSSCIHAICLDDNENIDRKFCTLGYTLPKEVRWWGDIYEWVGWKAWSGGRWVYDTNVCDEYE